MGVEFVCERRRSYDDVLPRLASGSGRQCSRIEREMEQANKSNIKSKGKSKSEVRAAP